MGNDLYIAIAIAIMSAVTVLLRALPFLAFGGRRRVPGWVTRLGGRMPYAVMAILVVYCLRNISFFHVGSFVPELLSAAVVVLLHIWKRQTILSIAAGTVCYMLLVQLVFV